MGTFNFPNYDFFKKLSASWGSSICLGCTWPCKMASYFLAIIRPCSASTRLSDSHEDAARTNRPSGLHATCGVNPSRCRKHDSSDYITFLHRDIVLLTRLCYFMCWPWVQAVSEWQPCHKSQPCDACNTSFFDMRSQRCWFNSMVIFEIIAMFSNDLVKCPSIHVVPLFQCRFSLYACGAMTIPPDSTK